MKTQLSRIIPIFIIVLVLFFLISCASTKTSVSQYENIEQKLAQNDFGSLIVQIEDSKFKEYKEKEQLLYYLDIGMLHHFAGNYTKSNEQLEKAENLFDELYTKSVSKGAASLFLNDNALEYSGEDYENIYTNIFKALNYLHLDNFDEAFVEIKRINNKLSYLEDKYSKISSSMNSSNEKKFTIKCGSNQFHNSALGRYLSLLMYRNEGKLDDARIDKNKIDEAFRLQNHIYSFKKPDISNYFTSKEDAKINIICFTGKSPIKKENKLLVTTYNGYIRIEGEGDYNYSDMIYLPVDDGFHIKFSFPTIYKHDSEIDFIKLLVDDKAYRLDKIEDIGNVATETFKVKEPIIYGKTLTRALAKAFGSAVFKKWVKDVAKKEAKKQKKKTDDDDMVTFLFEVGTDIMNWAVNSAVDATENADLRISHYFPNDCFIKEVDISAGVHDIKIEYYDSYGSLIYCDDKGSVNIDKNKLNLFESFCLR